MKIWIVDTTAQTLIIHAPTLLHAWIRAAKFCERGEEIKNIEKLRGC